MAKILVVDDSWLIRQTVTNYLKRAGYEVVIAENGEDGISKCQTENPACVVLDLLMPDINGLDVISRLHNLNIFTPVLILTADIQQTTQDKCREVGAFDFLLKPPKEENLIYKVERALDSRKPK